MSITPMSVGPSVAPAVPTAGETTTATGDPAAAGSFAALVADLLAGTAGLAGTAAPTDTADTTAAVEPADETDEGAADGSGSVPADLLATTAAPWVAAAPQQTAPQQQAALPVKDAAAPTVAGPVAGVLHGPVVTRATTTTPAAGTATQADLAPAATTPAPTDGPGPDAAAAAPAAPGGPATGDAAGGDPTPGDGDQPPAQPAATQPTAQPSTQPTTQPAAVPPTAPPSTQPDPASTVLATPAVSAPSAPAAPTAPVADVRPAPAMTQVVPEVTRLVSRGDGVHRLTMKLQPEALGEVRVTLTVRDGAVQVQLTGGEHAARALAEGAPELHRVLEMAGAVDARVVVRDLAGQQTATTGNQPGTPDQSYGAQGSGGDASAPGRDGGQQDQHARTRGGAAARDGLTDGATVLRPDPVRSAPRGVDLTM